jgi:hypothetical protein
VKSSPWTRSLCSLPHNGFYVAFAERICATFCGLSNPTKKNPNPVRSHYSRSTLRPFPNRCALEVKARLLAFEGRKRSEQKEM